MIPYLKYYLANNQYYQQEIEDIIPPTYEEWETLRGYEPTKINPVYQDFVETYIERKTKSREQLQTSSLLICKVAVDNDNVINETEQLEEFVKWI